MNNILIVEDNTAFRHTIKNMLASSFPYLTVDEAGEGEEGLQKVSKHCPEIIFIDIMLPGENGIVLTRKIKHIYPDTIIIILTNLDFPEYREAAHESGADYFLSKNSSSLADIKELVSSIKKDKSNK